MKQNTIPNIFYSTAIPTNVYNDTIYFWDEGNFIQTGISGYYPTLGGNTRTSHPLVLLSSELTNHPNLPVYSNVALQVYAAWLAGRLVVESYGVDEIPSTISTIQGSNSSAVVDTYTFIRIWYTTIDTKILQHIQIVDEHGFILGYNNGIIEESVTTSPTFNSDISK